MIKVVHPKVIKGLICPRLVRFGIIQSASCVLCNVGQETTDHLFFECPFSAYLLTLCRLKLCMHLALFGDLHQEADMMKERFKTGDKTYKLARIPFTVTIWHVWQERNRRIFQRLSLDKIFVFRRIYEDINLILRTYQWKVGNDSKVLEILSK